MISEKTVAAWSKRLSVSFRADTPGAKTANASNENKQNDLFTVFVLLESHPV
jgi:hypothetical protein